MILKQFYLHTTSFKIKDVGIYARFNEEALDLRHKCIYHSARPV